MTIDHSAPWVFPALSLLPIFPGSIVSQRIKHYSWDVMLGIQVRGPQQRMRRIATASGAVHDVLLRKFPSWLKQQAGKIGRLQKHHEEEIH